MANEEESSTKRNECIETSQSKPNLCPGCAKKSLRQSPINIIENQAKYQEFRPFTFTGFENLSISNGTLKAWNTGGTLKFLAKSGVAYLEGGPLNVRYDFIEMHFHWGDVSKLEEPRGSEHKINGRTYPLELHMVHKNLHDETIEDALTHENGLCVLAFLFEIVKENDNDLELPGLDGILDVVDSVVEADSIFHKAKKEEKIKEGRRFKAVNVANFLPFLVDEYFTYRGSLTTGKHMKIKLGSN